MNKTNTYTTILGGCWREKLVSVFGFGHPKSHFRAPENGHFLRNTNSLPKYGNAIREGSERKFFVLFPKQRTPLQQFRNPAAGQLEAMTKRSLHSWNFEADSWSGKGTQGEMFLWFGPWSLSCAPIKAFAYGAFGPLWPRSMDTFIGPFTCCH